MTGFERQSRAGVDGELKFVGRGSIPAALFDLGIYPAAVPASDARVWGEVHEILDPAGVFSVLDEIQGCRQDKPEASLYIRAKVPVTFDDGSVSTAWVYFYNAPLGKAPRIESGDYLRHLNLK